MQQHTKTVQDSIVESAKIANTYAKDFMQKLNAFHCMQILSDPSTGAIAYKQEINVPSDILEVCIKKTKAGVNVVSPFIYMKKEIAESFSSLKYHLRRIQLGSPTLVYIADEAAKRTPVKLGEWSIPMEKSQRIEITWLNRKQAYEVACFES